jgi:flagellar hook-length control protein FliK
MTSLPLPAGGGASVSGPSAYETAGQRNAAGRGGAKDGSAFGALLSALDEAPAPTHSAGAPGGAAAAGSRSSDATFAALNAGLSGDGDAALGVLVGLAKPQGGAAARQAGSDTPGGETHDSASSPVDGALALLLLGASGGGLPQPLAGVAKASTGAAANASELPTPLPKASARSEIGAIRPGRAPESQTAETSPVEVTIVRSVTYLGLDRAGGAGGAKLSASNASGGSASSRGTTARADATLGEAASAQRARAAAQDQSMQDAPNHGGAPSGEDADAASGAAATTGPANAATGATSGLAVIQINQLPDFLADAAAAMDSGATDAATPAAAPGADASRSAPVKELDVQLNPKSLGLLSIQMRLSNGTLNVTISAANPDTLKLVAGQSGAISEKLKSVDLAAASVTVKAMHIVATTGASGEAAQSGAQGQGDAYQDQSGQTAGGSSRGGQSFEGGGAQREPGRPARDGLVEPGGDPGHRFV